MPLPRAAMGQRAMSVGVESIDVCTGDEEPARRPKTKRKELSSEPQDGLGARV